MKEIIRAIVWVVLTLNIVTEAETAASISSAPAPTLRDLPTLPSILSPISATPLHLRAIANRLGPIMHAAPILDEAHTDAFRYSQASALSESLDILDAQSNLSVPSGLDDLAEPIRHARSLFDNYPMIVEVSGRRELMELMRGNGVSGVTTRHQQQHAPFSSIVPKPSSCLIMFLYYDSRCDHCQEFAPYFGGFSNDFSEDGEYLRDLAAAAVTIHNMRNNSGPNSVDSSERSSPNEHKPLLSVLPTNLYSLLSKNVLFAAVNCAFHTAACESEGVEDVPKVVALGYSVDYGLTAGVKEAAKRKQPKRSQVFNGIENNLKDSTFENHPDAGLLRAAGESNGDDHHHGLLERFQLARKVVINYWNDTITNSNLNRNQRRRKVVPKVRRQEADAYEDSSGSSSSLTSNSNKAAPPPPLKGSPTQEQRQIATVTYLIAPRSKLLAHAMLVEPTILAKPQRVVDGVTQSGDRTAIGEGATNSGAGGPQPLAGKVGMLEAPEREGTNNSELHEPTETAAIPRPTSFEMNAVIALQTLMVAVPPVRIDNVEGLLAKRMSDTNDPLHDGLTLAEVMGLFPSEVHHIRLPPRNESSQPRGVDTSMATSPLKPHFPNLRHHGYYFQRFILGDARTESTLNHRHQSMDWLPPFQLLANGDVTVTVVSAVEHPEGRFGADQPKNGTAIPGRSLPNVSSAVTGGAGLLSSVIMPPPSENNFPHLWSSKQPLCTYCSSLQQRGKAEKATRLLAHKQVLRVAQKGVVMAISDGMAGVRDKSTPTLDSSHRPLRPILYTGLPYLPSNTGKPSTTTPAAITRPPLRWTYYRQDISGALFYVLWNDVPTAPRTEASYIALKQFLSTVAEALPWLQASALLTDSALNFTSIGAWHTRLISSGIPLVLDSAVNANISALDALSWNSIKWRACKEEDFVGVVGEGGGGHWGAPMAANHSEWMRYTYEDLKAKGTGHRGPSCGLWLLFHTLVATRAHAAADGSGSNLEAAEEAFEAIKAFATTFMLQTATCPLCALYFEGSATSTGGSFFHDEFRKDGGALERHHLEYLRQHQLFSFETTATPSIPNAVGGNMKAADSALLHPSLRLWAIHNSISVHQQHDALVHAFGSLAEWTSVFWEASLHTNVAKLPLGEKALPSVLVAPISFTTSPASLRRYLAAILKSPRYLLPADSSFSSSAVETNQARGAISSLAEVAFPPSMMCFRCKRERLFGISDRSAVEAENNRLKNRLNKSASISYRHYKPVSLVENEARFSYLAFQFRDRFLASAEAKWAWLQKGRLEHLHSKFESLERKEAAHELDNEKRKGTKAHFDDEAHQLEAGHANLIEEGEQIVAAIVKEKQRLSDKMKILTDTLEEWEKRCNNSTRCTASSEVVKFREASVAILNHFIESLLGERHVYIPPLRESPVPQELPSSVWLRKITDFDYVPLPDEISSQTTNAIGASPWRRQEVLNFLLARYGSEGKDQNGEGFLMSKKIGVNKEVPLANPNPEVAAKLGATKAPADAVPDPSVGAVIPQNHPDPRFIDPRPKVQLQDLPHRLIVLYHGGLTTNNLLQSAVVAVIMVLMGYEYGRRKGDTQRRDSLTNHATHHHHAGRQAPQPSMAKQMKHLA